MSDQIIVVLDKPPLDSDPWATEVFLQTNLHPVSNDEISKAMAADRSTLDALLDNAGHVMGPVEELARYYRDTLRKLHGDKPRLGLYGTAWLSYVEHVDACVVDWSEVERRASAPGVPESDGRTFAFQAREFIHARTAEFVPPGRLLELEPDVANGGDAAANLIQVTVAFLRGLSLA